MLLGWRQPLLALQCCTCAVIIVGVGFAPSPCSLVAPSARLLSWRQPLLALQCCPCANGSHSILGVDCALSPCSLDALCAMPLCWRQLLLASRCCTCVALVCSHSLRRWLCSVVVLARCAVRHAPVRLLELQCCTCVQSQSPALALLRRRARWIRAAPRLLPGVHPPVLCCTTCSHFPRGRGPRRRARWLAFGHWLVARCSIPR